MEDIQQNVNKHYIINDYDINKILKSSIDWEKNLNYIKSSK